MDELGGDSNPEEKVFRFLRNTSSNQASKRTKCLFRLIPSAEQYRTDLEDVIFKNGGDVLVEECLQSQYAVTFLNEKYFYNSPDQDCVLPFDTFSSVYIYDSVQAKKKKLNPPDLNIYRLTRSKFESFDANKILFQHAKWSDLVARKTRQTTVNVTAQNVVAKWMSVIQDSGKEAPVLEEVKDSPIKTVTTPQVAPPPPPAEDSDNVPNPPLAVPAPPAQGKEKTPVKIVPSPRTKATSKPAPVPKLVFRGLAGPSNVQKTKAPRRNDSASAKIRDNFNAQVGDVWSSGDEVSYDNEDSDADAASRVSSDSRSSTRASPNSKYRQPFSINEGQRMLDLICANKAFMYTKGIKLWQLIESSGLFPGRTCQSLKEHFRKQVLPKALKAQMYKITPEDLKRLEKAQKNMKWTKHANVCPDFTF